MKEYADYLRARENLWIARQRRLYSHGRDAVWVLLWEAEEQLIKNAWRYGVRGNSWGEVDRPNSDSYVSGQLYRL